MPKFPGRNVTPMLSLNPRILKSPYFSNESECRVVQFLDRSHINAAIKK